MKNLLLLLILVAAVGATTYSTETVALGNTPPNTVYHCFHKINGQLEPFPYAMNLAPGQACPPIPSSAAGHDKTTPVDHDCEEVITSDWL